MLYISAVPVAQDLDMGMVEESHPDYDFYQLYFSNADTGHAGSRRDRTYVIASNHRRTVCRHDPWQLRDAIADRMRRKVATLPSDYFCADRCEVQMEAMKVATRRQITFVPERKNLRYLLTPAESGRLRQYEDLYYQKFGKPATQDPDLVCFLGDNPLQWRTWSMQPAAKAIPTMRRNAKTGLWFSPHYKRWLVPREKLAAMGWPVNDAMAEAMNCPCVPSRDVHRAADLVGNAMHFPTVAVAQLIALACFAPLDDQD